MPDAPEAINDEVVRRMLAAYRAELPLIDGAVAAVRAARDALAARARLVVQPAADRRRARARGPDRELPRHRLLGGGRPREAGARRVPRGGAPARRPAGACAAVEDSHSGIAAARAAGMRVVAIPNPLYPPGAEALAGADVVLDSIAGLTVPAIEPL